MSVYKNDNANDFIDAVHSIFNQTYPPNDIVLVVDGPVPDTIIKAIDGLKAEIPVMSVIWLEKNMGHAVARQTGLEAAQFEYVAIMDSDDIALPDRFEKQISFIESHPEVDAIGGQINEFVGSPDNVVGKRIVPLTDAEIKEYLKSRCPMNLVTVMLKKSSVENVGGYIDWYCEEDYYLWVRMAEAGMIFANLSDDLVNVRVGKEMYQRRGGMRYFKSEARLQKYMMEEGIISVPRYFYNITLRFTLQVLLPNKVRGWVFQTLARK